MTQRRLCLVRHAEAASTGAGDAARPLTQRGVGDAAAAGRWLADRGLTPDAALVSPALRARQTWERLAEAFPGGPANELDRRLYRNTLQDYLGVVREAPAEAGVLLVVGHNPSVADLLALLVDPDAPATEPAAQALSGYVPPGTVAVLDLSCGWADAGPGVATFADLLSPETPGSR